MTNRDIVLRKLTTMNEHRRRLQIRLDRRLENVVPSADIDDAIAMSLLVCIQEVVDIASHILTDEALTLPESAAAATLALAQHGILPDNLALQLAAMTALRNRIAHGYSQVDANRIVAELPSGLQALEQFASAIVAYLDRGEVR
ncbi:MAG: DUF86 domain-containing protein [Leptospirales bacterium]|nr:DUF86 domain-containing protein [Leptospirales bacterium]